MAPDDSSDGPEGVRATDRRFDPDPRRHLGIIAIFVREYARLPTFNGAEEDELFSIAYIEAADLLANKYKPICTVSTFLRRYLYGRVEYRYLTKVRGLKRWDNRYERPPPREQRMVDMPHSTLQTEEILSSLHPDIRPMAEAIANGDSLETVAQNHKVSAQWLRGVLRRHLAKFVQ